MALRISPDKKRRLRAAGIGGASSARVGASRPEARAGTSLAPSRGPRLEAAGPAPKRPSFDTVLAAKRGDARALVTIHNFTKHVAAKKAAAAQTDRLVSAQYGGVEQLAAKGYKTVNPRAGAIIKSLSPTEAAKDAYRAARKGQVGPAALAAASILPFGRGPSAAVKAVKVERAALRTLRLNEKVVQIPTARSRLTRRLLEAPADRTSAALMGDTKTARALRRVLPTASVQARVARHAGRELAREEGRTQARMVTHANALPPEGSPEDVAHFVWAQLPESHRNVEGLALVRAKQAAELRRVTDPATVQRLLSKRQTVAVKTRIADLKPLADDLARSVAQLDQTITANPQLDPAVLGAVHAFSGSRAETLLAAKRLTPEGASERQGLFARWAGLEPSGTEAYIGHRMARVSGARTAGLPASPGLGRVTLPRGVGRMNRQVLISQGRARMSTHVAREDWQATETYRNAVQARGDLSQMGGSYQGGPLQPGEMLVNPAGKVIPQAWRSNHLEDLIAKGANEDEIRAAVQEVYKGAFASPGEEQAFVRAAREQGISLDKLRVVPQKLVHRYYAQFNRARGTTVGGKAYDTAVDFAVANIVFARIGYIPKNIAQNLVMAVPHQGPRLLMNVPRAAQALADPELRPLLLQEWGSGATGALAQEARLTEKARGVPGKVAHAMTLVADAPLRVAAGLHELANEGVISKWSAVLSPEDRQAILHVFTDPAERPRLNNASWRATDAMADFNRMTPTQRLWARRFLIIPGWLVAGSRYPVHFAATHPGRSAALAYAGAGEPGAPERLKLNKPLNEYFAKGLPSFVQGIPTPWGVERTSSVSPVSTPWEIAQAALHKDERTVGDYLQPLPMAGIDVLRSQRTGRSGSYHVPVGEALKGALDRIIPNQKLVADLISPPKNPRTYPADKTRLGRLRREAGVLPIPINQEIPVGKKAHVTAEALVKKLHIGTALPAPVEKSFGRLEERAAAWKKATHGKKAGTRDYYVARYKADLALVQKWGYLSADQVAKATDWIGHAPVDDIRKAHAALSKSGGIYDREFSPARETGAWLKAQDSFSSDLDGAVKAGVLTKAQADRGRAWARKASHKDIDKARVALERKLLR